jgi:hypothetical protein
MIKAIVLSRGYGLDEAFSIELNSQDLMGFHQ